MFFLYNSLKRIMEVQEMKCFIKCLRGSLKEITRLIHRTECEIETHCIIDTF